MSHSELPRQPAPGAQHVRSSAGAPPRTKFITLAGAKGGVGKTVVATNLAVYLATLGKSVVLVDADVTGANAQTLLGVGSSALPTATLQVADATTGRDRASAVAGVGAESGTSGGVDGATETAAGFGALTDTKIAGIQLLQTLLDEPLGSVARSTRLNALRRLLTTIEADYVIVDVGAGTDPQQLDLFLTGDVKLLVTVAEPSALESGYRMLRSMYLRALHARLEQSSERMRLGKTLAQWTTPPSPRELVACLATQGDALAAIADDVLQTLSVHLAVNQVRVRPDLEVGDAVRTLVRYRLGMRLYYVGYVESDDAVWASVRARRPLMVESPGSKASKCMEKIARRLLAGGDPRSSTNNASRPNGAPVPTRASSADGAPAGSYHDLLEIYRGATEEEIRKAFKHKKEMFAVDSFVSHGLMTVRELEAVQIQLREAYDVLLDPLRRKAYELSVFPPGEFTSEDDERAAARPDDLPPAPRIGPETEFNGALLRAVRESKGVALKDISKRTKIGAAYLQSLEEEDFGKLPETVYVRGFVTELARSLELDPAQVARTYMRRVKQHREREAK